MLHILRCLGVDHICQKHMCIYFKANGNYKIDLKHNKASKNKLIARNKVCEKSFLCHNLDLKVCMFLGINY